MTTTLGAKDFPFFSDLYKLVEKKAATEQDGQVYAELALLINDIVPPAQIALFGTDTAPSPSNSQFICLDTNALQETSDSIKGPQYFNFLT